ncbi:MAG: thioredoxin domain-containing protein [Phycisphaerales bacterium]
MKVANRFRQIVAIALVLTIVSVATAKYSGGTGEPNDPYQIATAADLIALGEDPNDYDKHFILTTDIDLDPNLPGGRVFDKAIIAPDTDPVKGGFQGTPFTGVFDGDGHRVLHLTITGESCLGLFGQLGWWGAPTCEVRNVRVMGVHIVSSAGAAGGLVGLQLEGTVSQSYTTGVVSGDYDVGGLVGCHQGGTVIQCFSAATISGDHGIGGLVGWMNPNCRLVQCHSTGAVSGAGNSVGGLVGQSGGSITMSYSTGPVTGVEEVGGLVGTGGHITHCYSTGAVTGVSSVGGLVGADGLVVHCYCAGAIRGESLVGGLVGGDIAGFVALPQGVWDVNTSGVPASAGGVGLSTAEMMDPYMLGLNGFGGDPNWVLDPGRDYPRLAWEGTPGQVIPEPFIDWLEGEGTAEAPYRIDTADQLIFLGRASALCNMHFVLAEDIDLDPALPGRRVFTQAVIPVFGGVFNGGEHTIGHLMITGSTYLGLFAEVTSGGHIENVAVTDANIVGLGSAVGGMVGYNKGAMTQCHATGVVRGNGSGFRAGVGVLVGCNDGTVTQCYSTGTVGSSASGWLGGVGGLVGWNDGSIAMGYSSASVTGDDHIGGLVGSNFGSVASSYSNGLVIGVTGGGGLVGSDCRWTLYGAFCGKTIASFWDMETSGQATSAGGEGKTTAEMQMAATYLDAGWDFIDETKNGTEDIWWIDEGQGYPRLWWESSEPVRLPVIELDATTFDTVIAQGVVLVDFFATWCSHCTTQAPILEEVADRLEGKAQVAKLDIDKARSIAQRYGVSAVPTLILFQNGVEVKRFLGVTSADVLVAAILAAVDSM